MRNHRPTDAQIRVLNLIARGYTDRQIAEELGIAMDTARTHTHNLLTRMHAKNRTEAVVLALCEGWIECPL